MQVLLDPFVMIGIYLSLTLNVSISNFKTTTFSTLELISNKSIDVVDHPQN